MNSQTGYQDTKSQLFARNNRTTDDVSNSNYGYAAKSKINYPKKLATNMRRSKTGSKYTAAYKIKQSAQLPDVRSQKSVVFSEANVKRFNEEGTSKVGHTRTGGSKVGGQGPVSIGSRGSSNLALSHFTQKKDHQ